MYGIVNKGIRDMVIQHHGIQTWEKIKEEANCEDDFFMNLENYDDATTYNLVGAASKILNAPPQTILIAFGEFWMQFTATEGYGEILQMVGNSFPQFLKQLDNLHRRLGTTYKKFQPPSFICKEIDEETLLLEYHSKRKGLTALAIGIIQGLGTKFQVSVELQHLKKQEEFGYDEFLVKYLPIQKTISQESNFKPKNQQNENRGCPFSGTRKSR